MATLLFETMRFSVRTAIVCWLIPSILAGVRVAADTRPNLILVIADDMNWDDCGAYGHPAIRTPHIDQLAAEGMRFVHAYLTTNSCSPSRSSILTGRYPHNTGAEQLHWPLPASSITFAGLLRESGYHTAAAGKWHLGESVRDHFDEIYEASSAGFVLPSGQAGQPGKMIAEQPSGCEDWVKALEACPTDRPFFLWLAALDPHREYQSGALTPPHTTQDVIVPPYLPDTPEVREDLRLYYDEIGRLDQYVGRLLEALARRGVEENTLVLFISDNGRPFPRDKTTLYDGGIRTPWIVRWPKRIQPGSVSSSLVSAIDIAPTLIELASPDSASSSSSLVQPKSFEGRSFVDSLFAQGAEVRKYAFAEDHWHDYEDHGRCVITPQFKLIRNDYPDLPGTPPADAGRGPAWQLMLRLNRTNRLTAAQRNCFISPRPAWELYDLGRDPAELQNRYDDPAYRSIREELRQALSDWAEQTNDFLPSRRTPDEFDRLTGEPDNSVRVRPRRSKLEMFGTNGKY